MSLNVASLYTWPEHVDIKQNKKIDHVAEKDTAI